jgi:hypothetical protein
MKSLIRLLSALALALAAPLAGAAFHTFAVERLYSNADGTIQFIVLKESFGLDGQNLLAGHLITSQHGSSFKTFQFPVNLPGSATAGRRVLIATQGFAALGAVTPDYVVPNGFLATDGGTVNFAQVDAMTYTLLPTDGTLQLERSGATSPNVATNFAGASGSVPALPVTAVEFYNLALDHYFISALQPDIDALDSGRLAGWARTAESFKVYPSQAAGGAGVNPVCRIYIPPALGDSHFISASPQECNETRAKFPRWSAAR